MNAHASVHTPNSIQQFTQDEQIGRKRESRKEKFGVTRTEHERLLMGWIFHRVVGRLFIHVRWRLFVSNDLWRISKNVWVWYTECQNMEKSTSHWRFYQNITIILFSIFLSINVDYATRGVFTIRQIGRLVVPLY